MIRRALVDNDGTIPEANLPRFDEKKASICAIRCTVFVPCCLSVGVELVFKVHLRGTCGLGSGVALYANQAWQGVAHVERSKDVSRSSSV